MAKRGSGGVTIDDSVFQRKVVKLARKWKVDEVQFIKDQSRLLAREVAKFTPPYVNFPGGSSGTSIGHKTDLEQGEWAVYYDLKRIFAGVPDEVAARIAKEAKGGPVYRRGGIAFAGVASHMHDMSAWHNKHKNARGRTRKVASNGALLVGWSLFHDYAKKQQAKVGIAKCAFYKASLAFGGKSAATPKIKRHLGKASGSGQILKKQGGTIGVSRGMADGLNHVQRLLPNLRKDRLIKATKRLQYLTKAAIKESGFKTK